MQSAEELQEILTALQRENQRLRLETAHANLLLNSLASLLTVGRGADPFANVFASLRNVFDFEMALMLVEGDAGRLDCIAATPESYLGQHFAANQVPQKVQQGRVAITFAQAGSFADQPELANRPGLFLPVDVHQGRGALVLFGARDAQGFDRNHVPLAQKYSLLVGHALETRRSNLQIMKSETRALAAEQASSMKNLLIANMSHEFRTPLNAILGFSELLQNNRGPNALTPLNREYIQHIHSGGKHLLGIVNNLLLLAKIGAGEHKPMIETIDLAAEVKWAVTLLGREAEYAGLTINLAVSAASVPILADSQSTRQILLNIIGNAIKFSPSGTEIGIRIDGADSGHELGATYSLSVSDQGPGIPAAVLAELGKPFVQAEDALSRRNQGSGLGLAITYGLAEAMLAAIDVESIAGQGTTVNVTFKSGLEQVAAQTVD